MTTIAHPIKLGIVGLGYWGPNILRNCKNISLYEIKMICDLDEDLIHKYITKFNLNCGYTTNYNELITNSEIDAIIIITPVHTHYSFAKKALLNNKHVLVEKPMTTSTYEADELIKIAEERSLTLMCDHTYCYHSVVQYLKNVLNDNKYGDTLYIDSTRINLGLFQSDINVIWDLAPHDISIILYLLGNKNVKDVKCSAYDPVNTGLESIAYIDILFDDNTLAHINVNWLSPVKVRKMIIGCSKKMLEWDDLNVVEKIKIYDKGINIDDSNKNKIIINYRNGDIMIPTINETEALYTMLTDFAQCIYSKEEPISGVSLSRNVVKIIEMAINANKKN